MAIVTFTSDFGYQDGYAAAMKGVVLAMCPGSTLVDVTHGIAARDVGGGAFALAQAAPSFPPGTVHLAVVDPGVGGSRPEVVVQTADAFFVGPDNGLLSLAARPPLRVFRITSPEFRRDPVSPTFHGRDVFAPAAARLAGGWRAADAGPELPDLAPLPRSPSAPLDDAGRATVVHVDGFGNLITSLPATAWVEGTWTVEGAPGAGGQTLSARAARTYGDVPSGQLLVYVGSGGHVELALRDGSAAQRTGLRAGDQMMLRSAL